MLPLPAAGAEAALREQMDADIGPGAADGVALVEKSGQGRVIRGRLDTTVLSD